MSDSRPVSVFAGRSSRRLKSNEPNPTGSTEGSNPSLSASQSEQNALSQDKGSRSCAAKTFRQWRPQPAVIFGSRVAEVDRRPSSRAPKARAAWQRPRRPAVPSRYAICTRERLASSSSDYDVRRYRTSRRVTSSTNRPAFSSLRMSGRRRTAACVSASTTVTQTKAARSGSATSISSRCASR